MVALPLGQGQARVTDRRAGAGVPTHSLLLSPLTEKRCQLKLRRRETQDGDLTPGAETYRWSDSSGCRWCRWPPSAGSGVGGCGSAALAAAGPPRKLRLVALEIGTGGRLLF